jgi:hypothetical protein
MALEDRVKWEFPSGATFVARGVNSVAYRQQDLFFINGLEQFVAAYETFFNSGGKEGAPSSLKKQAFLGSGAGVTEITVDLSQWEGSTDEWGGVDAAASAQTKRDRWVKERGETPVDSRNLVRFSHGEYSEAGAYAPWEVVIAESDVSMDYANEGVSIFQDTVTMYDAVDLQENIDAQLRNG